MKIRKEQMEAFSKSRKDAYVALMVEHLRTDFPNELEKQNLAEEDLEPFVRGGITDAEQYGLVCEDDVARYLECRALLGPKFDRDKKLPWAREILRRKDLDGQAKIDEVEEHMLFELEEPV